jgi:translocation and assembly module TamA
MNFSLLIIFLFLFSSAFAKEEICSGVIIHGMSKSELELSDTEDRLVCGDKKIEAYKNIPPYQAAFFMTAFLQSRGHLNPKFETINKVLHVHVGNISELNKVNVTSELSKENKIIKKEISRRYEGKTLTPKLINDMEGEAVTLLRKRGYPCAEIKSVVNPETNNIKLSLLKTNKLPFGEIEKEKIEGLHENALERYYPFTADQKYNEALLDLTEKRMLRSEVVQVTYFMENCSQDGEELSLTQSFMPGPPRTFRYGVGASTELGPMLRVKWSNNRSGPMASTLSARVQGSLRSQSLTLTADTFFWKHKPRRSLVSQLEILRESQIDFEQFLVKLSPGSMKWTEDRGAHHWTWLFGPSFESGTFHSKETSNTKTFNTGVIEGSLDWMAHKYEFYDIHPHDGDKLSLNFGFRHPSLGFTESSLRLNSSYVKLKRLAELGRGILVGGIRLNAGTLWISDEVNAASLPPNVKFYGGGSDDIRGFLLNTLPRNDGDGAITRLSAKFELRKTYLFKESIEGFSFIDTSYFGDKSFSTLPQLFYSPGLGIRWHSPIGMVQVYGARALSINPTDDDGNFFYVGLGGSF